MKTHQSEFSLLAQGAILAHSATPGCCFDNLVSTAPNNVQQYISDTSACEQHADPERVRSLLRQSDDMPVPGASRTAKSAEKSTRTHRKLATLARTTAHSASAVGWLGHTRRSSTSAQQ